MIITIDGPGASGKSVIAQRLAERLGNGYRCLNTGAMYRAIGMLAMRDCPQMDDACVTELAKRTQLDFDWDAVPPELLINGQRTAGRELLSGPVANAASRIARIQPVRHILIEQQVRIAESRPNLVSEGRDQGSVVFPNAPFKFFLTADVHVRARRRLAQLIKKGKATAEDEERVARELAARDEQDMTSEVGRLVVPHDAQTIDTSDIHGIDAVADVMVRVVEGQMAHG